jgi:hypothetical protein
VIHHHAAVVAALHANKGHALLARGADRFADCQRAGLKRQTFLGVHDQHRACAAHHLRLGSAVGAAIAQVGGVLADAAQAV